jgi:hypothetical protein
MLPAIFSFFLCPCCPSREKAKHSSWLLVRLPLLVLELDSWIGSAFVGFLGYRIGCCRVARRRWLNLILAEFFLVLRPISSHLTILLFVIRFRERLRLRALHLPTADIQADRSEWIHGAVLGHALHLLAPQLPHLHVVRPTLRLVRRRPRHHRQLHRRRLPARLHRRIHRLC